MKRILFLFALCFAVHASDKYVAKTGNDANPGTAGSPKLTIQAGVDAARAGDTVYVATGYYAENVRTADFAGSSGSPITINGQGVAVVDSVTLEEPYIYLLNFAGITNKTVFGGAIYLNQIASHCIVSNNVIDPNFNALVTPIIKWNGADAQPFGVAGSFNTIISNRIQNVRAEMVFRIHGDTNLITGNLLANLDFTDCKQIFGRANIFSYNICSNLFFSGLNDNHADCGQIFGSAGGSSFGSKWHLDEGNIYIGGPSLTNSESLWQVGNYTDDGNPECKDITIRNNVFVGIAAKCSITMPGVLFYNNIFVRCSTNSQNGGAVLILNSNAVGNATGGRVFNNVAIDCGIAGATNTGMTYVWPTLVNVMSDYNYVIKNGGAVQIDPSHRAVGDVGGWDTTDWWEPNGINGPKKNVAGSSSTITADPGFINASALDFRLLAGSPMVSAGLNLTNFTTDIRGVTRDTWEIGPYEFSAEDFASDLPCWILPRTIRAYPVVSSGQVQLFWPNNALRNEIRVSLRIFTNKPSAWPNWTPIYTNSASSITNFGNYTATITNGIHYEFEVRQTLTTNPPPCRDFATNGYRDFQYISTGYQVPLKDTHGNVILLVESGVASSLATELTRLKNDLIGEGHKVFRHDLAANEVTSGSWKTNVTGIKSLITTDYNTDTSALWKILIIGHVPIPYSGENSPGSHADNNGAHPADWYYADMSGTWTDTTVNNSTADNAWTRNVPSDGKFDQSEVPASPTMQIGRVDFRNMSAFGKTEVQLLKQYLDRNHNWRTKQFTVRQRGLVYNDADPVLIVAGNPVESHNTYASFFGNTTSTDLGNWLTLANSSANSYLAAAKQGSGHYTEDVQLGTIEAVAAAGFFPVAFPSSFGSYHGDWDSGMITNVFTWAWLASDGYSVASYYHENFQQIDAPAMDEPIGYEQQAMGANYFQGTDARYSQFVRIISGTGSENLTIERKKQYESLLGDPTLRMRQIAPPTGVVFNASGADNVVSWTASTDTGVVGYHVYRASTSDLNTVTRLTSVPTTSPITDAGASSGSYTYWVRTVKLEDSPNRSFYSASQGVFANGGGVPPATPNVSISGRVVLSGYIQVQ